MAAERAKLCDEAKKKKNDACPGVEVIAYPKKKKIINNCLNCF